MWRRSPRGSLILAVLMGSVLALVLAPTWIKAGAQTTSVTATVETDPVPSGGDADDPAIWVHPTDPSQSIVIGSDKENGLAVYDLSGNEIQFVSGIEPNNVDIRHDFHLGGQLIDLVVSSDRADDSIALHRVDPATRQLVAVGTPISTGIDIYGICLYHSPVSGSWYVFVTSEEAGPVGQFELTDNGSGGISGNEVRRFQMSSTSEGCVADDGLGYLYVTEEDVGIWKYDAEPDGGSHRVSIDEVGPNLEADVEGATIYYGPGESGYLVISSQGSSDYAVYRRDGDNEYVSRFEIGSGPTDETTGTDGIDVISTSLGSAFPDGLFVAHDSDNDSGENNFKLVSWDTVAASANPSLMIETAWNPRAESPNLPRAPLPDPGTDPEPEPEAPVDDGVTWTATAADITTVEDDGQLSTDGTIAPGVALVMEQGSNLMLRFSGIEIPQGAVLRSAYVQFTAADDGEGDPVLSISGVLADGETGPVTWAPAPWASGDSGPQQRTPDLSRVIGEVVAGGWEADDVLALVISATGSGQRSAVAFDQDPESAPSLRLQFALDY